MTREEAIRNINALNAVCASKKFYDEEFKEALQMAVKALEQEPILDKVRAEIEACREDEEPHLCDYRYHRNEGLEMALDIIDKYRESEGKE